MRKLVLALIAFAAAATLAARQPPPDPKAVKQLRTYGVPFDPQLLKERGSDESRRRAFAQVVRDVQDKLTDDPQTLRDLRRFARDGTFPPAGMGTTSKATVADVKDRAVFLKKTDDRW